MVPKPLLWLTVAVVLGMIAFLGSQTLIPNGPPKLSGNDAGVAPIQPATYDVNQSDVSVGHSVSVRDLVFLVRKGMPEAEVLAIAGKPYRRGGPYGHGCWFYRASKKGTSIDGMRFCFKAGRVSLVQTAVHS